MRWPPWSSDSDDEAKKKRPVPWADTLNATNWQKYTEAETLIPTILMTSTFLVGFRLYRLYLRRIPGVAYVQPKFYRKRSLFGTVTRVGDGDNFHLYHTPGGRLTGWGWLPWRKVPEKAGDLKDRTISIRIAGIDAPEGAHWGREGQPYATEALTWLRNYILNRRVRAFIYRRDQYDRIVARVLVRRGIFRRDVGLEMLRAGLATVYEAKAGAEFGNKEDQYRKAEAWARLKRKGMWSGSQKNFESPREYKTRGAEEPKKDHPKTVIGTVISSLFKTKKS